MQGIDKRMEGIDTRMKTIDERMETLDKRMETNDRRMKNVENTMATQSNITDLSDRMENIENGMENIENAMVTKDDMESLPTRDDITRIEQKLKDVDARVEHLVEDLKDTNCTLERLTTHGKHVDNMLDQLIEESANKEDLANIRAEIKSTLDLAAADVLADVRRGIVQVTNVIDRRYRRAIGQAIVKINLAFDRKVIRAKSFFLEMLEDVNEKFDKFNQKYDDTTAAHNRSMGGLNTQLDHLRSEGAFSINAALRVTLLTFAFAYAAARHFACQCGPNSPTVRGRDDDSPPVSRRTSASSMRSDATRNTFGEPVSLRHI